MASDQVIQSAADPLVASRGKLAFEPVLISITTADQPKAACLTHCRGESAAGNASHWREQHRVFDAELFGEARSQRHVHLLKRAARYPRRLSRRGPLRLGCSRLMLQDDLLGFRVSNQARNTLGGKTSAIATDQTGGLKTGATS